jgi:hyperosmotically inducible periplasmic protein
MRRVVTVLAILAVALTGAVGCRSTTGQSLGTNIDNQTLKASVKSRLVADRLGNLTRIGVDANEGIVSLTGTVESPELRERAEQIAREADGVRQVVNSIQVTPPVATATTAEGQTAQTQRDSAAASPAAAPRQHHTLTGEITDIDADRGRVTVRTAQRDMDLYLPAGALQDVRKGDRVAVEIGIRPLP